MNDEEGADNNQAHLFTLRIWAVKEGGTAPKWRSRLQNIQSGEVQFCTNWDSLIACLEESLREQNEKRFRLIGIKGKR